MKQWFIRNYIWWHNKGFGPCGFLYNGAAQCGYSRLMCMHNGSPDPTIPIAGRHEYVPTELPPKIDVAAATPLVTSLLRFPLDKPPAVIGLDDRILTFNGIWPVIETLRKFKPWNKQ